jgi:hypothetical protein
MYGNLRARPKYSVDPENPNALGVCDRCGFLYNHKKLSRVVEWQGKHLRSIALLVCETCLDKQQLHTILIPNDPVPIMDPRPEQYGKEIGTLPSGITPGPYGDFPQQTNNAALNTLLTPSPADTTDPVPAATATPPSSDFSTIPSSAFTVHGI